MPVCAATVAPTRSMAIITISTGAKVHSVALSTDSHSTCGATCGRGQRPQQRELREAEQAGDASSPGRSAAASRGA